MANGKHRPGYQAGLDFDIQPVGVPAGYALGLEFVRGPVPPRPDPSAVRPGGGLPAPAIAFAGVLHASVQSSAATLRPAVLAQPIRAARCSSGGGSRSSKAILGGPSW